MDTSCDLKLLLLLNDHIVIMRQKALASEGLSKLIADHKFIDQKEAKLIELRGLKKRKSKVRKPKEIKLVKP